MKRLLLLAVIALFAACSKSNSNNNAEPGNNQTNNGNTDWENFVSVVTITDNGETYEVNEEKFPKATISCSQFSISGESSIHFQLSGHESTGIPFTLKIDGLRDSNEGVGLYREDTGVNSSFQQLYGGAQNWWGIDSFEVNVTTLERESQTSDRVRKTGTLKLWLYDNGDNSSKVVTGTFDCI